MLCSIAPTDGVLRPVSLVSPRSATSDGDIDMELLAVAALGPIHSDLSVGLGIARVEREKLLLLRPHLGPVLIADENVLPLGTRLVRKHDGLRLELGYRRRGQRRLLLQLKLLSVRDGRR